MAQILPTSNIYAIPGAAEIYRNGYSAVAAWIARDCDDEAFVFRKFNVLAARNLLYLQCELFELEAKLQEYDLQTLVGSDMTLKRSAREWESFTRNHKDGPEGYERMKLILDIRAKIKEYRTFVCSRASCRKANFVQMKHSCYKAA